MRDIHFIDPDLMGWKERFDMQFVKQGIPIGIAKYENKDGTDITPSKIKDFITETLEDQQAHFIEMLEEMKEELQNETGSFKHDEIFDLIISKVKKDEQDNLLP